jgi:hypothetical protein
MLPGTTRSHEGTDDNRFAVIADYPAGFPTEALTYAAPRRIRVEHE